MLEICVHSVFQIYEAADVIQKLHLIAQELPSGKYVTIASTICTLDWKCNVIKQFHVFVIYNSCHYKIFIVASRFENAKAKIAEKYDEIERSLIMEFIKAHRAVDKDRMKEIASTLSHFKGYSQCIDAFIEEAQHVSVFLLLQAVTCLQIEISIKIFPSTGKLWNSLPESIFPPSLELV